jgi:hypothetical protein
LEVKPTDFHPNADGHAVLARRLAEALWPLPPLSPLRTSSHQRGAGPLISASSDGPGSSSRR